MVMPSSPGAVERGHVNPRHLSQIAQQLCTAQTIGLGLRHHKADLRKQFLPVPRAMKSKKAA